MQSLDASIEETWIASIPGATASADEDFFGVGGTSITAAKLIQGLRDRLGVRVPLMLLFENPRYADFAASVREFASAS